MNRISKSVHQWLKKDRTTYLSQSFIFLLEQKKAAPRACRGAAFSLLKIKDYFPFSIFSFNSASPPKSPNVDFSMFWLLAFTA